MSHLAAVLAGVGSIGFGALGVLFCSGLFDEGRHFGNGYQAIVAALGGLIGLAFIVAGFAAVLL